MKNILTIAKNTFRETIRDRILYAILTFAIIFIVSTLFFGSISLGEDIKIIKDLGLAGIYIFSLIITIFLGASLIYKELEKRTIYIIFSKPVSYTQFVLGKFLGLWFSVIFNIILMTVVYSIIVLTKSGNLDFVSLWSVLLLIFEIAIFIAITILFSTFTTPLAGTLYSIIILYIGHSLELLKREVEKSGEILKLLAGFAYYFLPNLEKFNIRNSVVYNITPDSGQIIYPIVYSITFCAILIWLSILVLKNQDL